jgi:hypothetical protein
MTTRSVFILLNTGLASKKEFRAYILVTFYALKNQKDSHIYGQITFK